MYNALAAHGCLLILLTWAVSRKYGTVVNPVTYFAGFYGVQTVISPALYVALEISTAADENAIVITVGFSALYFACIAVPFLLNRAPFYRWLRFATNHALPRMPRPSMSTYVAIVLQFALFFGVLIVASGTTQWLTESRTAYQESRAGVGVWWSLSQAMLLLLVAAFLQRKRRSAFATAAICLTSACGAYFLGSKSFMLFPFVIGAFYYQYRVRPIPRIVVLLGALGFVVGIFALQFLQGTAATLLDAVAYFDYFPNTARFIQDFNERFQHTWGETWLSNLWQYVPRGLYPGKPFTYGQMVIMEDYNPGAAELGATPGILPWAAPYLDLGWVGVMFDGLLTGLIARGAFDLLRRRGDLASIVTFGQIGLILGQFFCKKV